MELAGSGTERMYLVRIKFFVLLALAAACCFSPAVLAIVRVWEMNAVVMQW